MNRTEEYIHYNKLFDIYGALLNEREKEIFALFYEEDLSLQEIADVRGVSKSAIGSAITTINKKLDTYEEKLGFLNKINTLESLVEKIEDKDLKEKIEKTFVENINAICKKEKWEEATVYNKDEEW